MLYGTFKAYGGTLARFGRYTRNLPAAVSKAAAVGGEVRPLGSLTPVWVCAQPRPLPSPAGVYLGGAQPLRPAARAQSCQRIKMGAGR